MVETEGVHAAGIAESDFRKQIEAQTPLGRIGQPEDIAPAAVFLASADSALDHRRDVLHRGRATASRCRRSRIRRHSLDRRHEPARRGGRGGVMAGKLEGKVAVVTGGNSGIGLATAKRFAAEGAKVFITGRRQAELDAAVKRDRPRTSIGVQGDVSKLADLDRLYADGEGEARAGRRRCSPTPGGGEFAPLGQITEEHFDKMFDINVKGLLFTVQKALPLMPDGGSIILNASIVSIKGMPAFSVYSATKAAVRSFARTWTVDLKDRKIRVNALSPGPIETPGLDGLGGTRGGGRAVQGGHGRRRAAGPDGPAGRDRQGRRVPRVRRQQLRHRHRAVRRRRDGADLTAASPRGA